MTWEFRKTPNLQYTEKRASLSIIVTKFVAILPNIATNVIFHPFVAILGSIATNLVTIMRVMATRRIADNVGALRAPRYRQPCGSS